MSLDAESLCRTFQERADWTGTTIRDGLSTRVSVMEEALTTFHLLEVARRHPEHVLTRQFTRREEGAKSGADWLWCIGEPGAWISLLVQAKIVSPMTGTCQKLDYRDGQQRRSLQTFARNHRLLPLYCIYSHLPSGYEPASRISHPFHNISLEQWSCAWITPKRVRELSASNEKNQESILDYSTPWMYPLCAARGSAEKLATALASGFASARVALEEARFGPPVMVFDPDTAAEGSLAARPPRIQWEDADPERLVSRDLPRIVERLLSGRVPATKAPVASVGIVSTVPVRQVDQIGRALPAPAFDLPRGMTDSSMRARSHEEW
jgi:hypothetical protein